MFILHYAADTRRYIKHALVASAMDGAYDRDYSVENRRLLEDTYTNGFSYLRDGHPLSSWGRSYSRAEQPD
jgi:hypothetical protein